MVNFYKVVSELPEILEKDAIYAVRTGGGFDLYIADATGNTAHGLNGSFITASATVATPRYIYFDLGSKINRDDRTDLARTSATGAWADRETLEYIT